MYDACAGPFNTILHFPYDGSYLDQPAKLIDFFQKIRYYSIESMEEDTDSVSEPDPEKEAQETRQRLAQLQGN